MSYSCRLAIYASLCVVLFDRSVAASQPVPFLLRDEAELRQHVEGLIIQLGHSEFRQREWAHRELIRVGQQLRGAVGWDGKDLDVLDRFHSCFILQLHEARRSTDREIQARADQICSSLRVDQPIGQGHCGWILYALLEHLRHLPIEPTSDGGGDTSQRLNVRQLNSLNSERRRLRRQTSRLIIAKMASEDPAATAAWVLSKNFDQANWLPVTDRSDAVVMIIRAWAPRDFDGAMKWCKTLIDYVEPNWPPAAYNLPILANVDVTDHLAKHRLLHRSIEELVKHWPHDQRITSAVDLLRHFPQSPNSGLSERACVTIARHWAKRDPHAAVKWANVLPWIRFRTNVHVAIIETVVREDVERAKCLVRAIETQDDRDAARYCILLHNLRTHGKLDQGFLDMIENSALRVSVAAKLPTAVERMRERERSNQECNPSIAAFCDIGGISLLDDSKEFDEACQWAKTIWSYEEPESAARWMASHQIDNAKWIVWCRWLAKTWAHNELVRALRWVVSQEPNEGRAFALLGVAESLMDEFSIP